MVAEIEVERGMGNEDPAEASTRYQSEQNRFIAHTHLYTD